MKFKVQQSLFEGKKITFIPLHNDENGNWVDDQGMSIGHTISSGKELRNEMDPFANGKADGRKIDPNHYIPKADWDRASTDDSEALDGIEKEEDDSAWSKNGGNNQTKKKMREPDNWRNTGTIHYENDDESDEGYLYQICVGPEDSPNFRKGRWVKFNDAIC